MGQIGSSASYDDALEKAALSQMQRSVKVGAPGGAGSDEDRLAVRAAVQALEAAQAECGTAAIRLRSPHRKTGLAWEALASDFLERPADPLRQALLTLASARVVCRMLDLPKEFMDGVPAEAIRTAGLVLKRFRDEAGLSGASLEAFVPGVFPRGVPGRPPPPPGGIGTGRDDTC